jgi:hypothetical protein
MLPKVTVTSAVRALVPSETETRKTAGEFAVTSGAFSSRRAVFGLAITVGAPEA